MIMIDNNNNDIVGENSNIWSWTITAGEPTAYEGEISVSVRRGGAGGAFSVFGFCQYPRCEDVLASFL